MKNSNLSEKKRTLFDRIMWLLPKKAAHSCIYYFAHQKRKLNYKEPSTYDERIHYLMVYKYDESFGKYADKYRVREYIKECGFEDILVPLLGVYDSPEEIDFSKLPKEYILMTNHASGEDFYEIVTDNNTADHNGIRKKFKKAMKRNYAKNRCEYQYKKMKPCILCLEYLKETNHERLTDYKVVCVNGEPQAVLVCTSRDEGRDYYDTDWNYLEYTKKKYRAEERMGKPETLQQMLEAAKKISTPFPLARVDFYVINNILYFSEITLSPSSGNHGYLTRLGQQELAKNIVLK